MLYFHRSTKLMHSFCGVLFCVAFSFSSHAAESQRLPEVKAQIGQRFYTLEKVSTPEESEHGLMDRTRLPQGHGMLFPFSPPSVIRFWMKNTLIPLDMLFVSQGKIIAIQHNAQPCPPDLSEQNRCPSFGPDKAVDHVIELPARSAEKDGITVGSRVFLGTKTVNALHPSTPKVVSEGQQR